MDTPNSLNSKKSKTLFYQINKNWEELDETQKSILNKIWKVITYKWQLQILFNLPFLLWWVLDITFTQVHQFDLKVINYLNLPNWVLSMMGLGQSFS
tara:strand:- start:241 stop:531 length:291 start_codon:yes stop_codon:yes gene_type:complete